MLFKIDFEKTYDYVIGNFWIRFSGKKRRVLVMSGDLGFGIV